jgi:hypothetical protein
MMFWAELQDNQVVRVTVSDTAEFGAEWLTTHVGGVWLECPEGVSPGFTYDQDLQGFIPPQIFSSWILNEETLTWEAPVPKPDDGKDYTWDEEAGAWVEV